MNDVTQKDNDIIGLASDIVDAYATRNNIPVSKVPSLVAATHATLAKLCSPPAPENARPMPTAWVRRTITPDHIISLEDGRPYKALKRHLTMRGLTPDAYRRKWGLPPDYPMVAANYTAQRSKLAKSIGFGRIGFGRIRRDPTAGRTAAVAAQAGLTVPARHEQQQKAEVTQNERNTFRLHIVREHI